MTDTNNPTQDALESPSEADLGAVDQPLTEMNPDSALDEIAAAFVGEKREEFLAEMDPQIEESEEEVIDESEDSAEEEELAEDHSESTPDEADEEASEDTSDAQEVGEFVDFNEIKDMHLEIGGKFYTGSQLKSMIGRLESAGSNAREAAQAQEELDAREAQIAQQEEWINQRASAAGKSDQLAEMQADARKIQAAIEAARTEGDMYEVAVQKDKMDVLRQNYTVVKQEVDSVNKKQEAQQVAEAEKGLRDRGLGYLLEENAQSKAWTDYASSHLSPQELRAVTMIPALAEAIEKARKYDSASKSKGKKLKTSGKTLRPGANKPTVSQTEKKKQELANDPDAAFQDIANRMLGI